jgi:hypothetical protein
LLGLVYSKLSEGNQKSVIWEGENAARRNRSAEEKFLRAKMADANVFFAASSDVSEGSAAPTGLEILRRIPSPSGWASIYRAAGAEIGDCEEGVKQRIYHRVRRGPQTDCGND